MTDLDDVLQIHQEEGETIADLLARAQNGLKHTNQKVQIVIHDHFNAIMNQDIRVPFFSESELANALNYIREKADTQFSSYQVGAQQTMKAFPHLFGDRNTAMTPFIPIKITQYTNWDSLKQDVIFALSHNDAVILSRLYGAGNPDFNMALMEELLRHNAVKDAITHVQAERTTARLWFQQPPVDFLSVPKARDVFTWLSDALYMVHHHAHSYKMGFSIPSMRGKAGATTLLNEFYWVTHADGTRVSPADAYTDLNFDSVQLTGLNLKSPLVFSNAAFKSVVDAFFEKHPHEVLKERSVSRSLYRDFMNTYSNSESMTNEDVAKANLLVLKLEKYSHDHGRATYSEILDILRVTGRERSLGTTPGLILAPTN